MARGKKNNATSAKNNQTSNIGRQQAASFLLIGFGLALVLGLYGSNVSGVLSAISPAHIVSLLDIQFAAAPTPVAQIQFASASTETQNTISVSVASHTSTQLVICAGASGTGPITHTSWTPDITDEAIAPNSSSLALSAQGYENYTSIGRLASGSDCQFAGRPDLAVGTVGVSNYASYKLTIYTNRSGNAPAAPVGVAKAALAACSSCLPIAFNVVTSGSYAVLVFSAGGVHPAPAAAMPAAAAAKRAPAAYSSVTLPSGCVTQQNVQDPSNQTSVFIATCSGLAAGSYNAIDTFGYAPAGYSAAAYVFAPVANSRGQTTSSGIAFTTLTNVTNSTVSVTLPSGYTAYICAGGSGNGPITAASWVSDENDSVNSSSVGDVPQNGYAFSSLSGKSRYGPTQCSVSGTPDLSVAGIALQNIGLYNLTIFANATGQSQSLAKSARGTAASLQFVAAEDSFVVFAMSAGEGAYSQPLLAAAVPAAAAKKPATPVAVSPGFGLPSGCTIQQSTLNKSIRSLAVIATCNSLAPGLYNVTVPYNQTGGISMVAYVYTPQNVPPPLPVVQASSVNSITPTSLSIIGQPGYTSYICAGTSATTAITNESWSVDSSDKEGYASIGTAVPPAQKFLAREYGYPNRYPFGYFQWTNCTVSGSRALNVGILGVQTQGYNVSVYQGSQDFVAAAAMRTLPTKGVGGQPATQADLNFSFVVSSPSAFEVLAFAAGGGAQFSLLRSASPAMPVMAAAAKKAAAVMVAVSGLPSGCSIEQQVLNVTNSTTIAYATCAGLTPGQYNLTLLGNGVGGAAAAAYVYTPYYATAPGPTITTTQSTTVSTTTQASSSTTSVSSLGPATTTVAATTTIYIFNGTDGINYTSVTLTNNQSVATASPFQQLVEVPTAQLTSYINANWSNVEFTTGPNATGTMLQAWIEANASGAAALKAAPAKAGVIPAVTPVWVNIPGGIAANSSLTIYMNFMPYQVLSAAGPTGEAPQLSPTYAGADNGGQVFNYYWNFTGTGLPAGWATNGVTYVVKQGLIIQGGASFGYIADLSSFLVGTGNVIDMYGTMPLNPNGTVTYIGETTTPGTAVDQAVLTNTGGTLAAWQAFDGSGVINPFTDLKLPFTGVLSTEITNNVESRYYANYQLNATSTQYAPAYPGGLNVVGFISNYNATQMTPTTITWLRIRADAPNGVMPQVAIGALAPARKAAI